MNPATARQAMETTEALKDCRHLNGAAIIDAQGHETPITEEMIRKALESIDERWTQFRHS